LVLRGFLGGSLDFGGTVLVRCCGGLLATTLTARSKRSQASGSNSIVFSLRDSGMSRQPLLSLTSSPQDLTIGPDFIGKRPELELAVVHCVMAWSHLETYIAIVLGFLLKAENEAALAVFHSLRRSSSQYSAVRAAADAVLNERDCELLTALIRITQSIESARNDLVHGHFGYIKGISDGITWMNTNDYVHFVVQGHLYHRVMTDEVRRELYSKISIYKLKDLQAIRSDIDDVTRIWFEFLEYLRLPGQRADKSLIDARYQKLSTESRMIPVLQNLRNRAQAANRHPDN
jgi:hypothetical protein